MIKNNYKRLGDYIQKVDVRNTEDSDLPLMGLTIDKKFIPSVANTIGTDLSKYKVVYKNQFACSLMQVSRDGKLPIARLNEDRVIMSPAYPIFEVINENELLPEYLEMWFKRSEFDREAAFYAVGGVRGNLTWEDFIDLTLPIPSIEKQRQIVADYQAIENKIKTNEAICEKLEETATTIYRRWFEEFEFLDEDGKPYRSNAGKMVWNEELEKEVPEGWETMKFTKAIRLTGGGTPSTTVPEYWNGGIPFFTPADISGRYYSTVTMKRITDSGLKNSSTGLYPENTVFVTARGTVGEVTLSGCSMAMNQSCYAIKDKNPYFTHQLTLRTIKELREQAVGAVFSALVTKDFDQYPVLKPVELLIERFDSLAGHVYKAIHNKVGENQKLHQLQELLLTRMTQKQVIFKISIEK